jgi:hypothetical protein
MDVKPLENKELEYFMEEEFNSSSDEDGLQSIDEYSSCHERSISLTRLPIGLACVKNGLAFALDLFRKEYIVS